MFYKFMGLLCLVVGTVVSLSPLLVGNPYQVEQTIMLLLGLIGFGLFQIAESVRVQTGLSASSQGSNLDSGISGGADKSAHPKPTK